MRSRCAAAVVAVLLLACGAGRAEDAYLRTAGPYGVAYVGFYYGLTDLNGSWYVGEDFFGGESRAWMAVVDTGGSATILGKSTQDAYKAYNGVGLPMQPWPQVQFIDEGFGGTVSFAVTQPLRVVIADFKTANESPNPEDPSLYSPYGPSEMKLAASRDYIGGGLFDIDFDIIGMSAIEGQVLQVDPHYLEYVRLLLLGMAGSLERPPPPPDHPRALYVPLTLHDFFNGEPQTADVGRNPVLPVHLRHSPSDPYATAAMALFDTGSGSNFISESLATAAGIDVNSPADLSIVLSGIGGGEVIRPGWYVDALAMDLGNGREGDRLVFTDTAVFVLPDEEMPGGLEAIVGNGLLSPATDDQFFGFPQDTALLEWYVDMRDPDNGYLILVPAKPGDANFDDVVDGADYTIWADNYHLPGSWAEGDFNQDGYVDGADYTLWADHLDGGGGTSVAEPAALLLLAAGAVLSRRRR